MFFCELGKAKRKSFHTEEPNPSTKKTVTTSTTDFNGVQCELESINGKEICFLVIVDDFSPDILGLTSEVPKNETPGVLIDFLHTSKRTHAQVTTSSAVHAADNPDKHQQHNTHTHFYKTTTDVADPPPLNIHSTHQTPTQVPTVTAPENIIQAETNTENA
ncbi:hypothetical protein Tco_0213606 [Tanacetum coccineum]